MKKIISFFLSIIIAFSFSSCSKKNPEDKAKDPNKISEDYFITLSDNSKRFLSYGDTVKLFENKTVFQKVTGGDEETIESTCAAPFGVKPGDSLDSFISAFNVKKGSAALLYNKDGYVSYDGDFVIEEGKMGCLYLAYGITESGIWTEFNFEQTESVLSRSAAMNNNQKLIIIGATFDSSKKLLYIGIITGTFIDITNYIKK